MAPRPSNFANGYADHEAVQGIRGKDRHPHRVGRGAGIRLGEKIQLVLNSFDLPDVVYGGDLSVSDAARYGKEGVLIPLNDLIEEHTVT